MTLRQGDATDGCVQLATGTTITLVSATGLIGGALNYVDTAGTAQTLTPGTTASQDIPVLGCGSTTPVAAIISYGTHAITATIVAAPPVSTAPPVVSGTAAVDSALSANTGTWTGTPTNYTYTWYSCSAQAGDSCSTAVGGDSSTYSPTGSDVGNTIHVCVAAGNGYGDGTAACSQATNTIPDPEVTSGSGDISTPRRRRRPPLRPRRHKHPRKRRPADRPAARIHRHSAVGTPSPYRADHAQPAIGQERGRHAGQDRLLQDCLHRSDLRIAAGRLDDDDRHRQWQAHQVQDRHRGHRDRPRAKGPKGPADDAADRRRQGTPQGEADRPGGHGNQEVQARQPELGLGDQNFRLSAPQLGKRAASTLCDQPALATGSV